MEKPEKKSVILVVEDAESNYLYLKAVLRKIDTEMIWVKNGQEAVETVRTNPEVDLVLMDLQMPIMNGFDATRKIKELRPDLPVIAQTAFVMPEDVEMAKESGCDDFWAKPIKSKDILDKIKNFL